MLKKKKFSKVLQCVKLEKKMSEEQKKLQAARWATAYFPVLVRIQHIVS